MSFLLQRMIIDVKRIIDHLYFSKRITDSNISSAQRLFVFQIYNLVILNKKIFPLSKEHFLYPNLFALYFGKKEKTKRKTMIIYQTDSTFLISSLYFYDDTKLTVLFQIHFLIFAVQKPL